MAQVEAQRKNNCVRNIPLYIWENHIYEKISLAKLSTSSGELSKYKQMPIKCHVTLNKQK